MDDLIDVLTASPRSRDASLPPTVQISQVALECA